MRGEERHPSQSQMSKFHTILHQREYCVSEKRRKYEHLSTIRETIGGGHKIDTSILPRRDRHTFSGQVLSDRTMRHP